MRRLAALVTAASLVTACTGNGDPGHSRAPASAKLGYSKPRIVGRIQAPDLIETSGIDASYRYRGVYWAVNDSGNAPVLYCLKVTGEPCGAWNVAAGAVDWEDIAVVPGPLGSTNVFIADIGDNEQARNSVTIQGVSEPDPAATTEGTLTPETIALTYPDGPHDAEALIVDPRSGSLYVITKSYSANAFVFRGSARGPSRQTLEKVATLPARGVFGTPTGADLSPDGKRLVVITYGGGFELIGEKGGGFDSIWSGERIGVDLGSGEQPEAVAYSSTGRAIISTSEGEAAPIYAVEVSPEPE